MAKLKRDSYSGTAIICKSKTVVHCSTYTYNEWDEEENGVGIIENPKEIEITSNESCEQSCSAEFTIPKDYLTDNFKNILSKAELVIHLGANDVPLLINMGGKNYKVLEKQNSKKQIIRHHSFICFPILLYAICQAFLSFVSFLDISPVLTTKNALKKSNFIFDFNVNMQFKKKSPRIYSEGFI